jgi:hypothetical protein
MMSAEESVELGTIDNSEKPESENEVIDTVNKDSYVDIVRKNVKTSKWILIGVATMVGLLTLGNK